MRELLYGLGRFLVWLSGKDGRCTTTYKNIPGAMRCQLPAGHGGQHRSQLRDVHAVWLGDEVAH